MSGNGLVFQRGCHKLGIETRVGPVAIVNGRFGNCPHCIYRGFCQQGCNERQGLDPHHPHPRFLGFRMAAMAFASVGHGLEAAKLVRTAAQMRRRFQPAFWMDDRQF